MRFFFEAAILNFLSRPFWIFFCFISVKNPALLYEVSFFSALWMVFPESWKRSCPNVYAHDCKWMNRIVYFFPLIEFFFSKSFNYWISTNSFWKWKLWKFSYSFCFMAIFYFINWIVAAETIQGRKLLIFFLFRGKKYSRALE